jgi:hypothetical protein
MGTTCESQTPVGTSVPPVAVAGDGRGTEA